MLHRKEFIRLGLYGGISSLIGSSIFLSSCGVPLAVAVEEFIFETVYAYLEGELVSGICGTIIPDEVASSALSDIIGYIRGGQIKGSNNRYKWSFREANKNQIITIATKNIFDSLSTVKTFSIDSRFVNDNGYRPIYDSGIGKYPLFSNIPICNSFQCHKIDYGDERLAQYEIAARRGYRLPDGDTYYAYFKNSAWYNNLPSEYYNYDLSAVYNSFNDIERANYDYLSNKILEESGQITNINQPYENEMPQDDIQNYNIGNPQNSNSYNNYNTQPPIEQPYSIQPSPASKELEQVKNDPAYHKQNGSLKKGKIVRELNKHYRKSDGSRFKKKDIE